MRGAFSATALLVASAVIGAAAGEWFVARAEGPNEVVCRVRDAAAEPHATNLARLDGVPEASGLALSHRTPGMLWTFNDSDDPTLYAVDTTGAMRGRVGVDGATMTDWEDISWGPCEQQNCLYIADIGDNHADRADITVYRVPEPKPDDARTAPAERFVARYPDVPHDAEALFVVPNEGLFIVTKEKPATIYRFPQPLQPHTVMTLQEVALLPMEDVTDAETSPDGVWVGIRSNEDALFFRSRELVSGGTEYGAPVNLRGLGEPQGEGLAIGGDGRVYLAGEGGNKKTPGTFTSVTCTFPANGPRRN